MYGEYATKLLTSNFVPKSNRGVDCGDHPPITPTTGSTTSHLRSQERRLYDMIVRHFLASVSPPCVYVQTVARFRCAREQFEATGLRVLEPGFTELLPKSCPACTWCSSAVTRQYLTHSHHKKKQSNIIRYSSDTEYIDCRHQVENAQYRSFESRHKTSITPRGTRIGKSDGETWCWYRCLYGNTYRKHSES